MKRVIMILAFFGTIGFLSNSVALVEGYDGDPQKRTVDSIIEDPLAEPHDVAAALNTEFQELEDPHCLQKYLDTTGHKAISAAGYDIFGIEAEKEDKAAVFKIIYGVPGSISYRIEAYVPPCPLAKQD